MSLEFKKISGSTPYFLNSASTAEELTVALEDYMRTGAQIIFTYGEEECVLSSFEYKSGIESTVIAYFVSPTKKLIKVDTAAGYDLVITESEITPELDKTLTQENKAADAKATGEAIVSIKSTINDLHTTGAEVWLVGVMEQPLNYADLAKEDGGTVEIHVVDQLPDTLTPVDMENLIIPVYVVESTGIAYCNFDGSVMTMGQMLFEGAEGYDKGWATDINSETEIGIYSVRAFKDFAEKKDITWENLPDKPFGETTVEYGDTVTWDGNIDEGNDVVTNTASLGTGTIRYVKVANSVPTIDDVGDNPTLKFIGEEGVEQTPETIDIYKEGNGIIRIGSLFVVIVPTDNIEWAYVLFPEKGVYFLQMITADGSIASRCTSFTIPNYNFGTKITLKKIDEKYLPDTILIKSESIEIWMIDDDIPENLTAQIKASDVTINIEVVDTLPESLELTSMENGIMNVYVVESTGIAYLDVGEGTMTFGLVFTGDEIYDKGWSTDISAETEGGIYCVRTEKNVPTKEYVDNAIANASGGVTVVNLTLNPSDGSIEGMSDDIYTLIQTDFSKVALLVTVQGGVGQYMAHAMSNMGGQVVYSTVMGMGTTIVVNSFLVDVNNKTITSAECSLNT